jgi:SWI/SNF-related matrix-associated actin-dependent regulator of chromatin subfamily A containing DEAD/H box 1
VQNSPKELMSLLCFLMPLFSRKSSDEFDDTQGHDGGESMLQYFVSMQSGVQNDDQAAYKKLKQLFSPFVLRRRKQDVLSQILPPKEQRVEFVELDSTARMRYNSIIADHVEAKKKGTSTVYEHLFTQLRKAAHHPLMLRSRYTTSQEKEHLCHWFHQYGAFRGEGCTKAKVAEELDKFNDFDIHLTASELIDENPLRRKELERYVLDEQDLFCSAKFVCLQKLLPKLIKEGHRVLIFSVWTTCLDLLSCLLEQMGLGCLRMDGSTAVSERQCLIDQFNRDTSIPIFLLSTKACGLGLNLTSADTCIQHDLDFNPFNDLQAEDRCHRFVILRHASRQCSHSLLTYQLVRLFLESGKPKRLQSSRWFLGIPSTKISMRCNSARRK